MLISTYIKISVNHLGELLSVAPVFMLGSVMLFGKCAVKLN